MIINIIDDVKNNLKFILKKVIKNIRDMFTKKKAALSPLKKIHKYVKIKNIKNIILFFSFKLTLIKYNAIISGKNLDKKDPMINSSPKNEDILEGLLDGKLKVYSIRA